MSSTDFAGEFGTIARLNWRLLKRLSFALRVAVHHSWLRFNLEFQSTHHPPTCELNILPTFARSFPLAALALSPESAISSYCAVSQTDPSTPENLPLALHIELLHLQCLHLVRHDLIESRVCRRSLISI
jgi:hypothetical protein